MKWHQNFHVVDITEGRNVKPSELGLTRNQTPKGTCTDTSVPMQGSLQH